VKVEVWITFCFDDIVSCYKVLLKLKNGTDKVGLGGNISDIREVPGLNLGQDIDYSESFCHFALSFKNVANSAVPRTWHTHTVQ
jgi:hypothetical protein